MESLVHERVDAAFMSRNIPAGSVVIENILLQDIDLPATLDEAIANVQRQRQATAQSEQALLTATAQANRLRTEAEGEAQARGIRANAEAMANRTLTLSLTPAVIELRRIEAMQALSTSSNSKLVLIPTGTSVNLVMPQQVN